MPIRTKSRPRTTAGEIFIRGEIQKLLQEGVIVKNQSPWRSQVVIVTRKKTIMHRLCRNCQPFH